MLFFLAVAFLLLIVVLAYRSYRFNRSFARMAELLRLAEELELAGNPGAAAVMRHVAREA